MVGSVLKFDNFEKIAFLEDFFGGGLPPPPVLITAYVTIFGISSDFIFHRT